MLVAHSPEMSHVGNFRKLKTQRRFVIDEEASFGGPLCVIERSTGLGVVVESLDALAYLMANGAERYLNSRFNGITR